MLENNYKLSAVVSYTPAQHIGHNVAPTVKELSENISISDKGLEKLAKKTEYLIYDLTLKKCNVEVTAN